MVKSGVVAAIHVAGVCCDPCGAMRWTVLSKKVHVLVFYPLLN